MCTGDGQRDSISAVVDDTNLTGIDSLRAKKMIAVGKPIQQSVASGEAEIMAETGDLSIPCIYPPSCIANEHTCNFHNRDVLSTSVKSYFRNWPLRYRNKKRHRSFNMGDIS